MRVPTAAAMSVGTETSFDEVLQQVVDAPAEDEPSADAAPAPEAQAAEVDDAPVPTETEREAATVADTPLEGPADSTDDGRTTPHTQAARPEFADAAPRRETERQPVGVEGTGSRPFPRGDEPLRIAVMGHRADAGTPVVAGAATTAVGAVGGTKAATGGLVRGFDPGTLRPGTPTAAAATTAGYRTTGAASAELVEQARDSIFQQVLLKLTPEGGEMRLRLQPPELGELDLRLVVEAGNRLSLTIGAERGEVAALLQRDMDQLRQALAGAGLQVSDAEVHTRGDGSPSDRGMQRGGHGAADDPQPEPSSQHPPSRGWARAEGLDFWA